MAAFFIYGGCMTQKIYIPIGIPASGKTYYYMHNMDKETVLRVSRDDINAALSDSIFTKEISKVIRKIEISTMQLIIENGFSVYIDRTNLTPKVRKRFINKAKDVKQSIYVVGIVFDNNPELSIERNKNRNLKDDLKAGIERFIYTATKDFTLPTELEKFDEVIYINDKTRNDNSNSNNDSSGNDSKK